MKMFYFDCLDVCIKAIEVITFDDADVLVNIEGSPITLQRYTINGGFYEFFEDAKAQLVQYCNVAIARTEKELEELQSNLDAASALTEDKIPISEINAEDYGPEPIVTFNLEIEK